MSAGAFRWLDKHKAYAPASLALEAGNSSLLELAEQLARVGHWRVNLPDHAMTWSVASYRIHGLTPDCYRPEIDTAIGFYHPDEIVSVLVVGIR